LGNKRINVKHIFGLPADAMTVEQIGKTLDTSIATGTPEPFVNCLIGQSPVGELTAEFFECFTLPPTTRCDLPEVNIVHSYHLSKRCTDGFLTVSRSPGGWLHLLVNTRPLYVFLRITAWYGHPWSRHNDAAQRR
jgi:hypothetical protein